MKLLGLLLFSVFYVTVMLLVRIGVEIYVRHEEKKNPSIAATKDGKQASVSQQAISRYYYNTKKRGA